MSPSRNGARFQTVILTALSMAACRGSLTSANSGPGDNLTADIGVTARDEVEAALSALTLSSTLGPLGTVQAASGTTAFASPACVSPSSPTDSDGDGIPDDAIYLFTAPPCRFTGWRGGTLEIVGQLRIQDPAPTQAGFGYEATVTALRTRFTSAPNKLTDVTRNGTRVLSGSISSLILSTDLQVIRTFTGKPDAAIDQKWTVTYTPSTSLQINAPVPSGTLDIAGTINWTRGTEGFSLTVTTPTPLHYNVSCTDTVQRIDGGELQAAGTIDGMKGFVRVRWNGCGKEPASSFVAAG